MVYLVLSPINNMLVLNVIFYLKINTTKMFLTHGSIQFEAKKKKSHIKCWEVSDQIFKFCFYRKSWKYRNTSSKLAASLLFLHSCSLQETTQSSLCLVQFHLLLLTKQKSETAQLQYFKCYSTKCKTYCFCQTLVVVGLEICCCSSTIVHTRHSWLKLLWARISCSPEKCDVIHDHL